MRKCTVSISDGGEADIIQVAVGEQEPERGALLVIAANAMPGGYNVSLRLSGDEAGIVACLLSLVRERPAVMRALADELEGGAVPCRLN